MYKMRIYLSQLGSFFRYFILLFILSFIAPIAYANINLQGQVPHAQFNSLKHDFGTIYQGQIMSHSFSFQNIGNGVLVLTSLHASCGCVNARALSGNGLTPKNIFKPGEKGMIAVEFDSSQFSGDMTRTVTVETNGDMNAPTSTLTLKSNIKQEIKTTPALLYLGQISKRTNDTYYIRVNLQESGIKITHLESDLPFVEAKLVPSSTNPNLVRVMVKLKKTTVLPIGPFRGTITLKNTSKYYKNLQIPILGEVTGHLQASDKFVEFGVVSDKQFKDKKILFTSTDNHFSVKKVKVDLNKSGHLKIWNDKDLFVITKTDRTFKKNGIRFHEYALGLRLKYPSKLNVRAKKALLTGVNVSGSFLVETNDPAYTEIRIPFFGVLKHE